MLGHKNFHNFQTLKILTQAQNLTFDIWKLSISKTPY